MKQLIKTTVMAFIAMFAFSIAADAQEWAYQGDYSEGLACVKDKNGKWGFIDEQGKLVGQMWRSVKYFQEGLGAVETEDEYWGYVDKTGKLVIPCKYRAAAWFNEGLSAVTEDYNSYGYIDKEGNVAIPFKYRTAFGNNWKGFPRQCALLFGMTDKL